MSVQSLPEKAALAIQQTFSRSITALAADTCEACARTVNGTGFRNMPAEQLGRLRLSIELAGREQALIFRDTHKVGDYAHRVWAFFSLFQEAAVLLIEVAYDELLQIERAQPALTDGWALKCCLDECAKVSKAIPLWTQNATHAERLGLISDRMRNGSVGPTNPYLWFDTLVYRPGSTFEAFFCTKLGSYG